MQNTKSLFENSPVFRKIVNSTTDIGSVSNTLMNGFGFKYDFMDLLSSVDIEQIMDQLGIKLNGIYPKDMIPQLKNGMYILNLDNAGNLGTHWVAFIKEKQTIFYFDSYGLYPPQNLIDYVKKNNLKVHYNITQIQDNKSILCGYFCIAFFHFIQNSKGSTLENCFLFDEMFKKNTAKNDSSLIKYFKRITT